MMSQLIHQGHVGAGQVGSSEVIDSSVNCHYPESPGRVSVRGMACGCVLKDD